MKNKRFFWIIIYCLILITLNACSSSKDSPPVIVTAISAGNSHNVALKNDGTALAWGYNGYGQLGNITADLYSDIPIPVDVTLLTGVTAISAGGYRTVAIKNDGSVWAWGYNLYGELGDGTTTNRNTPVQVGVTGNFLTGITAISVGGSHTVALKNDGTFWDWGKNDYGQLGDGTNTNKNIPTKVDGLTGIAKISAGGSHTVALKNDHTVLAWGLNSSGQLGDGSTTDSNIPVTVGGSSPLTDVMTISAGEFYTVAIKNDGTVWAWGSNGYGQLGDGTTIDKDTPVPVSSLTGIFTAIAAGYLHTVALKNDGTVWAWGRNDYGQLGNGTTTDSDIPVKVNSLTGITAISAGESHTVALKNDGTLWAWGRNNYGQLGDGTTSSSDIPVNVK